MITADQDLAELDLADPNRAAAKDRKRPKRQPLPPNLPRREIRHEPASTTCGCGKAMKRIGEEVSEKLDYPSPASSPWSGTSAACGPASAARHWR